VFAFNYRKGDSFLGDRIVRIYIFIENLHKTSVKSASGYKVKTCLSVDFIIGEIGRKATIVG